MQPPTDRAIRCRYLTVSKRGEVGPCPNEAADPEGEIVLCPKHLARALEMLKRVGAFG